MTVEVETMKLSAEITKLQMKNERDERNAQNEEVLKVTDELIQVQHELADAMVEIGRLQKS